MKTLLKVNLDTKTAMVGSEPWSPPPLTYRETLTLALRFEQTIDGQLIEPDLDITSMKAAIGPVDARPLSETWALQIGAGAQTGANTTDPVAHDCTAGELKTAINAKPAVVAAFGLANVRKSDGSFLITFGAGAVEVPLRVRDNKLYPISLGRVAAAPIDDVWVHEVRLIQTPVAFTDTGERVLPPPPTIERLTAGGTEGEVTWNELQALTIPADYRGTYALKLGFSRTAALSVVDGPEEILAALVSVLGANFKVTLAAPFLVHIEFIGAFAGEAMGLLDVLLYSAPPGDLTFSLPLDRFELLALLRANAEVTLPLTVRLVVDDGEDETEIVAFRQDVLLRRPLIFPELSTVPRVDWLRPASPKNYIPFNPDTVITGQQYFPAVVGDGAETEFEVAHGLATDAVFVFVRENISSGLQLIDGTDYRVRITSADDIEVESLVGAPPIHGWLITVMSAQTVAAFAAGLTITIGQVTGLEARLALIEDRLAAIEDLLPDVSPGVTEAASATGTIKIPDRSEIFFNGRWIAGVPGASMRSGLLMPAIHDAVSVTLDDPVLPGLASAYVNQVFVNDAGPIDLPGTAGRRRAISRAEEFLGSDGVSWYRLTRAGVTNSYFPTALERELFMVHFNAQQFRAGATVTAKFDLSLQIAAANTRAQFLLVVEVGAAPSEPNPATTGTNLADITWLATPVLSQRIIVSGLAVQHHFGCAFVRSADGLTITASRLLYDLWTGGAQAPAAADFALRARLIQFDIEDTLPTGARGIPAYTLSGATAGITNV